MLEPRYVGTKISCHKNNVKKQTVLKHADSLPTLSFPSSLLESWIFNLENSVSALKQNNSVSALKQNNGFDEYNSIW